PRDAQLARGAARLRDRRPGGRQLAWRRVRGDAVPQPLEPPAPERAPRRYAGRRQPRIAKAAIRAVMVHPLAHLRVPWHSSTLSRTSALFAAPREENLHDSA